MADMVFTLALKEDTLAAMNRFSDSVDYLKQTSQSGASVSLQWPEAPTTPPPPTYAPTAPVTPLPAPQQTSVPTQTPSFTPAIPQAAPMIQPVPTASTLPTAAPGPAPMATPAPMSVAPAAPTAAPTYTMDQIAKAGAELAQAGKMPDLLALLQQFGVQAVTQIPAAQYGAFATALRGLGAQL